MTVTPTHRAAPRRTLRALLTAVLTAVVLAPFTVMPAAAAAAAPTSRSAAATPTPSPTPTATGVVEFTLSPIGNGVFRPGTALTVSVTIQNGTDSDIPASSVALALGSSALGDRAALSAWLDGDGTDAHVDEVGTATFPGVAAGAQETVGIMVDAASPALVGRTPGVYPLVATYQGPALSLTSTSVVTIPDDAAAPTGIGVIVPITAAPRSDGLLTPAELTLLTEPDGALTSVLDAVEGTEAILAIDPAIPAAIRVLGTRAPAGAAEWLARLEALPNSRFALQFADADVAVQLAAGTSRPLAPTSLQYAMRPIGFPAATPSPAPTPTATTATDPSAPAFPTLSELLDIGADAPPVYWPAPGTTSRSAVDALGAITVDDTPSLTLVPSTSTAAGASATVPARRTSGEAGVLVYDDTISRILLESSQLDDSVLRAAPRAAATAHLALAAKDAAGAPLLVTLDRAPDRSRVALATTLMTALEAPGTTPLTLHSLSTAAPTAVDLVDGAPSPVRTAAASTFFSDEDAIGRFATILDDPSLLTGPERASILQLLGVSWIADPSGWSTAVQEHAAATATTLSSVDLLPVGDIQQIGPSADIPIWVHNDLPYPVSVVLLTTPNDLRLDVQRSIPVTAGPQANTRVLIPVNAQIGSGEVEITLQLRSRTLEPIGRSQTALVTVRADWERYGVIALVGIVGLLLVVGVIRTIRRRRVARRADAPSETAASEASAGADASGPAEPRT